MDRIFLVVGASGGYSDACEWPVRAFAAYEEADSFSTVCASAAKAAGKLQTREAQLQWAASAPDPAGSWDAAYYVTEVPFGPRKEL